MISMLLVEAYGYKFYDFWWEKAITDSGIKDQGFLSQLDQFLEHQQVIESFKSGLTIEE